MAISENSLHPHIKGLVEEYGELTVTELNKLLRERLELDEHDVMLLSGRKDDKFSQIVRNVVAHAAEEVSEKNGYIIDKSVRPARFYAVDNNVNESKKSIDRIISKADISNRKRKIKTFLARKINFQEINKEKSFLGEAGECFALEWERRRLKDMGVKFDVLDEVVHSSQRFGDGSGYDILSKRDNSCNRLFIEVKTTKSGFNTPFYISENEKIFIEIHKDESLIYRVYNFDPINKVGELKIITPQDLLNNYNFDPITYKVTKK